ncbi:TPA: HNH endonuclease [Morganella morganii subsp. morganii]|uniref:HNH endonuclease n=1 Tax=Morganella morganii TaxID=582 RepID=A0AAU8ZLS5_MORMO|nr:HNH endonuclease signature motif containing protein [Morganella morganii]AWC93601.1 HNH endonuclease [Morganella morganii]EKW8486846.1 HNH endonuclease [Morganella morganii]HDU8692475.1 HNH endonuclease [Morganella morganii subsp. morganii]
MALDKVEFEEYKHYESYYFCNVIKNILNDQLSYVRGLNDYYGDGNSAVFNIAFPKWSHFHNFIEFIFDAIYDEFFYNINYYSQLEKHKNYDGRENSWPENFTVHITSFNNIHKSYLQYLKNINVVLSKSTVSEFERFLDVFYRSEEFQEYKEKTTKEVFYILFGNRLILQTYNEMIAEVRRSDWDSAYYDVKFTTKNGYLKRVAIPKWVQKAVYYRDKGRCVFCKKDLTGLINIYNKSNYDHIVPLAIFGINDVSNIQLLCESCNKKKNSNNCESSNDYFPWYII